MVSIQVSKKFKSQATRAIFSIILFIAVYLLLFAAAIGIAIGCGYAALLMVSAKPSFATLALGISIIAVGVFILYFMVKFMFTKNKSDYSHLTEIDIDQQPELKKMIESLVTEVGTKFPKKIFLSPEVNASVFYDSSFWSMILPVRKNLHIGLGLVNTTTVNELKGVLAHEFGHFSQKSMKVGSYVYNVNKVIHNILYDNDDYNNAMNNWAGKSGYFIILIWIATYFNKAVQYILQLVYKVVNLSYLGLSREMEFHADAIAAHVVGSGPMISSMLRIDLASQSYDTVLNYYNDNFSNSIVTKNVFPQQLFALNFIAQTSKIAIIDNLPHITETHAERFNKSKLVIKNQWDSHPSMQERISEFKLLNIPEATPDNRPANVLFRNISTLQEQISEKLFVGIPYPKPTTSEGLETFSAYLEIKHETEKYPELFNSYYDSYNVKPFDVDAERQVTGETADISTFFSDAVTEVIYSINSQKSDAHTLKAIADNPYGLKTFDYDGEKYKVSNAISIWEKVNLEIDENVLIIDRNDKKIFQAFLQKAQLHQLDEEYIRSYKDYFKADENWETQIKLYSDMLNDFSFAYETTPFEQINGKMKQFYATENLFRKALKEMLNDPFYEAAITQTIKENCLDYLEKEDLVYFANNNYIEGEIQNKNTAVNHFYHLLQHNYFLKKKKLLDFKASLAN